jgi:hypothetical protein
VIRRGTTSWCRLIHGDDVIELLDLDRVEELLAEAGVAMSALLPAPVSAPSLPRS